MFFTANESSERINLLRYSNALGELEPMASGLSFESFEHAMDFTAKVRKGKKTVLVIDELPYLCDATPYFPSALQYYMDLVFPGMDLMVIVCGSSIGMMDDLINDLKRPLYGRFVRQLRIDPLDYLAACDFFPDLDNRGCAEMYGIAGGTPMYLGLMSGSSVRESVKENFMRTDTLLREEFGQPGSYL